MNKEQLTSEHGWWCCPECGWSWENDWYYYVEDGKAVECNYHEEQRESVLSPYSKTVMVPDPPDGSEAYPKQHHVRYDIVGSMEGIPNAKEWEETHLCPNCMEKFTFTTCNW